MVKSTNKKGKSKKPSVVDDSDVLDTSEQMINYDSDEDQLENLQNREPGIVPNVKEGEYDDEVEDEDNLDDNAEIDDEDQDPSEKQDDDDDDEIGEDIVGDDKCIYKYADDELDNDDDNDEEDEEFFDDDGKEFTDIVAPEDRVTKPYLTKYERVRLLGDRTKQISLGAKPMIKDSEHLPPKDVAELELDHRVMPLFIERPLPNGKKERWTLNELIY